MVVSLREANERVAREPAIHVVVNGKERTLMDVIRDAEELAAAKTTIADLEAELERWQEGKLQEKLELYRKWGSKYVELKPPTALEQARELWRCKKGE